MMNDFAKLIESAKEQYNKLIIINDERTKSHDPDFYKKYCLENNIHVFNLSAELAQLLLDISQRDRDQEAADKLRDFFHNMDSDVIAFDNIDYLFSEEVGKINPINTFNYLTRKRKVIILFIKAKRKNNLLIYSEEGNPDYMELDISNNEGFVIGW
jgi:hypothetical protein